MKDTFTIEEIRKYIKSQDSLGDVMYNLKPENIIKANSEPDDDNLLKWYTKGFNDEIRGTTTTESHHDLENAAYSIGAADAVSGYNLNNLDEDSEDILIRIKGEK